MTTILDAFAETVQRHGSRPAIVEGSGRSADFDEVWQLSQALAGEFSSRGIGHGDRVLMAMPVGIELYASLAALWSLGAAVVFPEPAMGLAGLRHAARETRPEAFLASGVYRFLRIIPEIWSVQTHLAPRAGNPRAAPRSVASADDIALISFTSGSTGAPKAIARSHAFMMAQHAAIAPLLDPGADNERDLVAFPVFVLMCLALGTTSVLPDWRLTRHDRADAGRVHAQIVTQGVTRLLVPPVICQSLSEAASLPRLGTVFTGGGPVFPDTMEKLARLQPDLRRVAVYGSTEAEPIAHLDFNTVSQADVDRMKNGGGLLAGEPVSDIEVEIDDGEILVTGPHVNKGYVDSARNAESKLDRNGQVWHRTGDGGRLDEAGRLWLLGRTGATIAGIRPFAIETAARFWPGAERSALGSVRGQPVLAVAGDGSRLGEWRLLGSALGVSDVRHVRTIPLDRRHRSKTDYRALERMLGKGG